MDDIMNLSTEIRDMLRDEVLNKSALWVDINRNMPENFAQGSQKKKMKYKGINMN